VWGPSCIVQAPDHRGYLVCSQFTVPLTIPGASVSAMYPSRWNVRYIVEDSPQSQPPIILDDSKSILKVRQLVISPTSKHFATVTGSHIGGKKLQVYDMHGQLQHPPGSGTGWDERLRWNHHPPSLAATSKGELVIGYESGLILVYSSFDAGATIRQATEGGQYGLSRIIATCTHEASNVMYVLAESTRFAESIGFSIVALQQPSDSGSDTGAGTDAQQPQFAWFPQEFPGTHINASIATATATATATGASPDTKEAKDQHAPVASADSEHDGCDVQSETNRLSESVWFCRPNCMILAGDVLAIGDGTTDCITVLDLKFNLIAKHHIKWPSQSSSSNDAPTLKESNFVNGDSCKDISMCLASDGGLIVCKRNRHCIIKLHAT
jgi:hypothetical protein